MKYLLSRDLSNYKPQDIPSTKMKKDIMRDQLPNPIRFIIDYIASWSEGEIIKPKRTSLYQTYLEWCEENGEKAFSVSNLGKTFSKIGIDRTRLQINGKREYHYILDRSKIVAKLRESGLGNMEEFSDIPQDDLPENETADIPIFNVPEIISPKIIPPQPEKNTPSPNTSKDKKADKHNESTQALFDYVAEDIHAPVASSSKTAEISKVIDPASPPDSSIINEPIKSENNNLLRSMVKRSVRQQREERLRKKAVELRKDPDKFITITDKDKLDSKSFRYRMEMDARMCGYAKGEDEDPHEHMDMTVRERLIGEEIIRRDLEEEGITSSWLDTDEEWKKVISVLQENGMLW